MPENILSMLRRVGLRARVLRYSGETCAWRDGRKRAWANPCGRAACRLLERRGVVLGVYCDEHVVSETRRCYHRQLAEAHADAISTGQTTEANPKEPTHE